MGSLFDDLRPEIDMTQSPTLQPKRARQGVISSPFPEPERPQVIAETIAAADHQAKDAQLLEEVRQAGTLGLSDAELVLKLRWARSTVCSTRNRVRLQLWFARRVAGVAGVDVIAWRLASS